MKWIEVLVCIVLSEILSRADAQVQLTVDVAGGTKTLVNIRSEAKDIPSDVSSVLSRNKRASGVRPFSTEVDEGSADYQTLPDMGPSGNNNLGSQSNIGDSAAGAPPFRGQPGGFPPPPGVGNQNAGGPRRRQQMKRKCQGGNNGRGCGGGNGNMQGNNGRRRHGHGHGHGHGRPTSDYGGGNWQSGLPSRGPPRRQNNQPINSGGADVSYNY